MKCLARTKLLQSLGRFPLIMQVCLSYCENVDLVLFGASKVDRILIIDKIKM